MSNPTQRSKIVELYRQFGGDIHKVARELGVRAHDIRRELTPNMPVADVVGEDEDVEGPSTGADGRLELGRASLRPFIVSYRHAHAGWPEKDRKALARARQAYDAGTHIMIQGRDGIWIIQYLWKRERVRPPINWFYGAFA